MDRYDAILSVYAALLCNAFVPQVATAQVSTCAFRNICNNSIILETQGGTASGKEVFFFAPNNRVFVELSAGQKKDIFVLLTVM